MSSNKPKNPIVAVCSFCGEARKNTGKQKPFFLSKINTSVKICTYCLDEFLEEVTRVDSSDVLENNAQSNLTPVQIKKYLDEYVVGQDDAKVRLSVAVFNHFQRLKINNRNIGGIGFKKSNVLFVGPTGSGKTLLAETLAQILNLPFVIVDATRITEAGYVGEDVQNILFSLYKQSGFNMEKAQKGIVYIDEIDKIAKRSEFYKDKDISGEGVQQALLKIIDGDIVSIPKNGSMKSNNFVSMDTSEILFIFGGAFVGLDRIIKRSLEFGHSKIGFVSNPDQVQRAKNVTPSDLEEFGMIPEFIGRVPIIAELDPLNKEDLISILTKTKNSLIGEYKKLFSEIGCNLIFESEAIDVIASLAIERGVGARGLRSILEDSLQKLMFDAPSEELIEAIITKDVILGVADPVKSYKQNQKSKKVYKKRVQ